ncbi:MAG: cell division protein ZipA [Gammaproteobacteria bacterium]|nr:cell division protein ZipA [Gammaproteobacteria bacterium]
MLTTIILCVLGLALIFVGAYLWYRRHIEDETSFGHDDVRWEQIDTDDETLVEKAVSELDQLTATHSPSREDKFESQRHADTPELGAKVIDDCVDEELNQLGQLMREHDETSGLDSKPSTDHSSTVSELQALQVKTITKSTLGEDPEMVISVHVVAKAGREFHGDQLLEVFNQLGLQHGDRDIFHFYDAEQDDRPIRFSVANMMKPGTFDLKAMDSIKTSGITLFMLLPGQNNTVQTFEGLFDTGQILARRLGGELRDSQRSTLTTQGVNLIKESIHRFYSRRKMSSKGVSQQGQLKL